MLEEDVEICCGDMNWIKVAHIGGFREQGNKSLGSV